MIPKISIVVPVYAVEKYIHECIESILNQTLVDLELILINDGSPDNCGEICDEYARKDERVKVIHKKNGGPGSARNFGIKVSTGEYVGFVDADDTVESNMYEEMYKLATKNDAEVVVCGFVEINNFTGEVQQAIAPLGENCSIVGEEIKKNLECLLSQNKILGYASMCNKLYKREYLIKEQLQVNEKIKIAEDLCFNLEVMSGIEKIYAIKEPLYKYRRVNSQSIMNKKEGKFYLRLEARKELLYTLKKINLSEDIYTKCLRYENSNTVAEYLNRIKDEVNSMEKIAMKYTKIMRLIHERQFRDALSNYSSKYFVWKARVIAMTFKGIIHVEKLLIGK
ncbi:glycosyltransferase [Bacillus cereus]|nr:glycosyltransferase [Bacillus cereus]